MTPDEREDAHDLCTACWAEVAPILRRHSTAAAITVLGAMLASLMTDKGFSRDHMIRVLDASVDAIKEGWTLS